MKMPLVASAACWRNTVELDDGSAGEEEEEDDDDGEFWGKGNDRMSMGMDRRWHAKMAFMMGMYWCARSVEGEAEISRIRDCSDVLRASLVDEVSWWPLPVPSLAVLLPPPPLPISDSAYVMDSRLMWLSARVRAPAIMVDVLLATASGVVLDSRRVRFRTSSSSTRRKGRYLLPEELECRDEDVDVDVDVDEKREFEGFEG